jgi:hypothetical protein
MLIMQNIISPKKKVGRPKGVSTTVKVKLLDLLRVLQPESPVVVGTLFARELDILPVEMERQSTNKFSQEELFD